MQFDAGMNVIDIGRTDVSPVSPKCVSFGNRALKAGITTSSWFISSARLLAPNPCADGMAQLAASYGSRFALQGFNPLQALLVVLGAGLLGWLGGGIVTGHYLRQTRPEH